MQLFIAYTTLSKTTPVLALTGKPQERSDCTTFYNLKGFHTRTHIHLVLGKNVLLIGKMTNIQLNPLIFVQCELSVGRVACRRVLSTISHG